MKKTILFLSAIFLLSACSQNKPKEKTEQSSTIQSTSQSSSHFSSQTVESTSQIETKQFESGSLLRAVQNSDLNLVKEILLSKDYQIDEQNDLGETPLVVATHNNYIDIAKALIDAGADVNKQDNIQDSAYLYAAAQGKTEILSYILKHSEPNQSVYNRFGGNSIIPAAEKGHLDNVKLLLEDGKVDINHQNNYGYTALIEAVALRDGSEVYQKIVRELLNYGADTSLKDNSGKTAEDYAREKGFGNILRMLQEK